MGKNDTPRTVGQVRKKHTWAWEHPFPGFEFAIKCMAQGAITYAATYQARYQVPVSRDPALGDDWIKVVQGIVALLDGETGRFHCPTVDGLLRATAEGAGFTLHLERHIGDPLGDDAHLAQDDADD